MSNNLNIDQVAENQANKEVTINTATGQLDAALTEKLTVDLASGSVSLTNTQYQRAIFAEITNVATSGRTVTLPAIKKLMAFMSNVANTNTINLVKGATTLTVAPGEVVFIYTDGTTDGLIGLTESSLAATKPYDVGTFCAGLPSASEVLLAFNYVRDVTLPAGLTGSRVTAGVAATATADFDVLLNGGSIGTIRFAAAGNIASFVGFSGSTIAPNDLLQIVAPGTPDATLANISFTLAGAQV